MRIAERNADAIGVRRGRRRGVGANVNSTISTAHGRDWDAGTNPLAHAAPQSGWLPQNGQIDDHGVSDFDREARDAV